jgi:hypothetical protein
MLERFSRRAGSQQTRVARWFTETERTVAAPRLTGPREVKLTALVDANREQAETLGEAIRASLEKRTPETRRPALRAGRCPGETGEDQRRGSPDTPRKSGSAQVPP